MSLISYVVMEFPEKLAKLIADSGMNQSRLSRHTGIAQSAISEMTVGKRRPYLDQGFRIARAIGVPLDYLADDEAQEPPGPALSDDEEVILKIVRALNLDVDAVIRALNSIPKAPADPGREPRIIATQDMTESYMKREEEKRAAEREAIKKGRQAEVEKKRAKDEAK